MTTSAGEEADAALGPLHFVAVEFPTGTVTGSGFSELLALVDSGAIFVVDLEFLRRGDAGVLVQVAAGSLGVEGLDLARFDGADSGLLDEADLELLGAEVSGDGVLAVLVYEDLTLSATLAGWAAQGWPGAGRRAGGARGPGSRPGPAWTDNRVRSTPWDC